MAIQPASLAVASESPLAVVLTIFVSIKAHGALAIRSIALTAAICARRCALDPLPTTQKPAAHRRHSESETMYSR